MKRKYIFIWLVMLFVILCVNNVLGFEDSRHEKVRHHKKVTTLDVVRVDWDKADTYHQPVIKLGNIDITKAVQTSKVDPKEYKEWFRSEIINAAKKLKINLVEEGSSNYDLELRVTLSKLDPGSAAGRMIAAELGLGLANVKIEGELIDKNGSNVIVFKESRSASANIGFDDIKGDAGPAALRNMVVKIASEIMEETADVFPAKS